MTRADRPPQNVYDDPEFLAGYSTLERAGRPWGAAFEHAAFSALLPDPNGLRILDLGCGAGQLTRHLADAGAKEVVGVDLSERMLERARRKSTAIEWVRGDVLALPFRDGEFDAATIGFGIRNVSDLERGLCELRRVLRVGGRLAVLEITRPRGPLRPFFRLWFDVLVPLAGKVLPGGEAYTYLPASVRRFPRPEHLAAVARDAGFNAVRQRTVAGGIVALLTAEASA